ncbi:MAG TPA: pyridoxal-phosphate dependent enzyme [Roseiflexaceae bacterium]|nr:pyridoxal-phosphate dependent enzyme [Roseiflexaceae bacterium]
MSYTDPITFDDIRAAQQRLRGVAHATPVVSSRTLDEQTSRAVFLKCENLQRGGAFKFRGAYNTISQLAPQARQRGVLAFSSGNHAQGVALAARLLGAPAVICMPDDAPAVKVAATRGYGAEVIFYDRLKDDREAFARRIAEQRGMTLVPPYDDVRIMAGAGTAALELVEEMPDLDAVLVPIGGGGLIAGSALAIHGANPRTRVFGVEPAGADDTLRSLRAGERVGIPPPSTIADGLRVAKPGALTFPVVQRHVTDILVVSDEEILEAVRFALLRLKLVIEPSGAATLAALLAGRLPPDVRRAGAIISGGNIDPPLLASLWKDQPK